MSFFVTNLYVFILGVVLAILEIQIEGKNGWAGKLPAWHPKGRSRLRSFFKVITNDREIDGYHLFLIILIALFFHLPFVFGVPLIWESWIKIVSLFFLFVVFWDYLWFVFNPWFTVRKFKKTEVPWHKVWWLGIPADYWIGTVISFLFSTLGGWLTGDMGGFWSWWLASTIFIYALCMVVSGLSLMFVKERK
jgi:hypothetical protein